VHVPLRTRLHCFVIWSDASVNVGETAEINLRASRLIGSKQDIGQTEQNRQSQQPMYVKSLRNNKSSRNQAGAVRWERQAGRAEPLGVIGESRTVLDSMRIKSGYQRVTASKRSIPYSDKNL